MGQPGRESVDVIQIVVGSLGRIRFGFSPDLKKSFE
jgi:hypothetical protein